MLGSGQRRELQVICQNNAVSRLEECEAMQSWILGFFWGGDCERCVFAQLCQKKHVTHCTLWISVHLAVDCFLTHTLDIIIPVKVT